MNIANKVALITGGAEGLGKAFAEHLLKKSAKGVSVVDIQADKGLTTTQEFRQKYGTDKAMFLQCDVTNGSEFREVFRRTRDHFGRLDIVINNAGILDEKNWATMVAINLNAVIDGTYLAQQFMSKQYGGQGGVVINIASGAGYQPAPYAPVYAATKHGVVAFTRSLLTYHPSFTPNDIRLNALCPLFVKTPIIEKGKIDGDDKTARKLQKAYNFIPIEDVSAALIKLIEEPHHGQIMKITATTAATLVHFPKL